MHSFLFQVISGVRKLTNDYSKQAERLPLFFKNKISLFHLVFGFLLPVHGGLVFIKNKQWIDEDNDDVSGMLVKT
mgnify:CR=1 FL=1